MTEKTFGPVCSVQNNIASVNDGTMCIAPSPSPGPSGINACFEPAPLQSLLLNTERDELRAAIQANKHELYVLDFDHMDSAIQEKKDKLKPDDLSAWEKLKGAAKFTADYKATAGDIYLLKKLIVDLGAVGAKAYIKNINGRPYIILKGYAGLRTILTSTNYPINHAKVVSMGLGKTGAAAAAKTGGIITIILLVGFRIADYMLRDEALLSELVGTIATDVVKVGISVGASIAAATVVAGLTTIAIGPLVAVIAVGVLTSIALDAIDEHFGITDKVIEGVDALGVYLVHKKDELVLEVETTVENVEHAIIDTAKEVIDHVIEEAVETTVRFIEHEIREKVREFLTPIPKLL